MSQALLPPLAIGLFHNLTILYNFKKIEVWKTANENIAKTCKEHEKACIEQHKTRQITARDTQRRYLNLFKRSHVCQ